MKHGYSLSSSYISSDISTHNTRFIYSGSSLIIDIFNEAVFSIYPV